MGKVCWCFSREFHRGEGGTFPVALQASRGDQRGERPASGSLTPNGAPSQLPARRRVPPYIWDGASASYALRVCRGKEGGGTDSHGPLAIDTLSFERPLSALRGRRDAPRARLGALFLSYLMATVTLFTVPPHPQSQCCWWSCCPCDPSTDKLLKMEDSQPHCMSHHHVL